MFQHISPSMPAFLFQIYCSQELYQSNEQLHERIMQIGHIFPGSAFLQIQRALLHYHSKGLYMTCICVRQEPESHSSFCRL